MHDVRGRIARDGRRIRDVRVRARRGVASGDAVCVGAHTAKVSVSAGCVAGPRERHRYMPPSCCESRPSRRRTRRSVVGGEPDVEHAPGRVLIVETVVAVVSSVLARIFKLCPANDAMPVLRLCSPVSPVMLAHGSEFAKVSDTLYRGAQPTADGFRELRKLGIARWSTSVTPLRSRPARGTGLQYVEIPERRGTRRKKTSPRS